MDLSTICPYDNEAVAKGPFSNVIHFKMEFSNYHYTKIISFVYYFFTNEPQSSFTIKFNHEPLQELTFLTSNEGKDYCGSGFSETRRYFSQRFLNSDPYLDFTITLNDVSGSWGFRELDFNILLCDKMCKKCTGPYDNQCSECRDYFRLTESNTCICEDGFWLNQIDSYNHTCYPCHVTCKTCNGPFKNNCLSCNEPFLLDENKICNITSK